MAAVAVGDGIIWADGHAVKTYDAARHVDRVVGDIDTLCRTAVGAFTAVGAEICVDVGMIQRHFRHSAEQCTDRTQCVAYQASAAVSGDDDHGQRGRGNYQACKSGRYRTGRGRDYTAESTVWVKYRHNGCNTCDRAHYGDRKD